MAANIMNMVPAIMTAYIQKFVGPSSAEKRHKKELIHVAALLHDIVWRNSKLVLMLHSDIHELIIMDYGLVQNIQLGYIKF